LERHKATIGVFGIPQNKEGKGLWSQRADGKGINAIGGQVDPEDANNRKTLFETLQREFQEEANVKIRLVEERPIGVFPTPNLQDFAILLNVEMIAGEPQPSGEVIQHVWMGPEEIIRATKKYDKGDIANGLLGGTGNRQWQMAKAFFLYCSNNPEYRKTAQERM